MKASRLLSLPPYLFEEIHNSYLRAVAEGRDVIDLSIGDPDLPPPDGLVERLKATLDGGEHHRYPAQRGLGELKAAVRRYMKRRAGIEPDDDEILILIGSKEGLAHLPWAVCNPGDTVVAPDIAYPVYHSAATFAGARMRTLALNEANAFVPDSAALESALRDARLCVLNYPNNPTSATASVETFAKAIELSDRYGVIVANDAAYADVYTGAEPPALLIAQAGALDRPVIELFSFSKMYSITGWRVGFAVGRRDVIDALAHLKANIDSSVFGAIQSAVGATLDGTGDAYAKWMRGCYRERRELATRLLAKRGFHCHPSYATFYLWLRVPHPWKALDFTQHLLETADVLVTPGVGFGEAGEGYFRIALTQPVARVEESIHRLAKL